MRDAKFILVVATIVVLIVCVSALIATTSAMPYTIAQESGVTIPVQHQYGSCWFFPDNDHEDPIQIYDIPASASGNDTYCMLTQEQTANMVSEHYNLVYTYPSVVGTKILKDVSWENKSLVSVFKSGGAMDERGRIPKDIRLDLISLINKSGIDGFEDYYIEIQQPYLKIGSISQVNESYFHIAGTTNHDNDALVTIVIDGIRHTTQKDIDRFTFTTHVIKTNQTIGFWGVDMKLPVQEMTAGGGPETIWHDADATCGYSLATVQFPLYQTWEPSPTPTQYIAYLGNGNIAPVTVVVTKIVEKTIYEDRWHTATPTPDITDALGNKIGYPYEPEAQSVSWQPLVALLAIAILSGIVIRRRS
jgi:hypothetical protein